jgi:glycosyltransferase involved in cell wall biosynthesis
MTSILKNTSLSNLTPPTIQSFSDSLPIVPGLVSVIIPVFNGAKTIAQTIASVQQQTFQNLEILVMDDGSQDETIAVVQQLSQADPRIQIQSHSNRGPSASRNRGLTIAKGEYVSFLDADDLWTPDKLQAQMEALQSVPEAIVAYSWTDFIDGDDRVLHSGLRSRHNGTVLAALLQGNFLESGSNALVRTDWARQVGGWDDSLWTAEDWDFYLRLAAQGPFVCMPKAQVQYRQSDTSHSLKLGQIEQDSLTVVARAFTAVPPELQGLRTKTLANLYQYFVFQSLQGKPSWRSSGNATRCLLMAWRYEPGLLRSRTKLMAILIAKISLGFLGIRIA